MTSAIYHGHKVLNQTKKRLLLASAQGDLHLWNIESLVALSEFEPRHEKIRFFCIYENKDADQLHGNPEADQRLCFR